MVLKHYIEGLLGMQSDETICQAWTPSALDDVDLYFVTLCQSRQTMYVEIGIPE